MSWQLYMRILGIKRLVSRLQAIWKDPDKLMAPNYHLFGWETVWGSGHTRKIDPGRQVLLSKHPFYRFIIHLPECLHQKDLVLTKLTFNEMSQSADYCCLMYIVKPPLLLLINCGEQCKIVRIWANTSTLGKLCSLSFCHWCWYEETRCVSLGRIPRWHPFAGFEQSTFSCSSRDNKSENPLR